MIEQIFNEIERVRETELSANILFGDLKDPQADGSLLDYQQRTAVAVVYSKIFDAHKLVARLEDLLKNKNLETRYKYDEILAWLSYVALADFQRSEISVFFQNVFLVYILQDDIFGNLIVAVKNRIMADNDDVQDIIKKEISAALLENQTILLSNSDNIDKEKKAINYWLKSYDSYLREKAVGALGRASFEASPEINRNISEADKTILKRLLDFYDFIKLPSDNAKALAEDYVIEAGDVPYLVTNGEMIELEEEAENKQPVIRPINQEVSKGTALPALPDIIKQAQTYLLTTNGEIPKVIAELQKSLSAGNALGATGVLLLLAQLRRLDDVLSDEPAFRVLVAQDLEASGQAVQKEGLNAQPNAPQFLARWLKIILQDNLHLKNDDALDFAFRLGELMALESEGYRQMVATDERGQLKWNT